MCLIKDFTWGKKCRLTRHQRSTLVSKTKADGDLLISAASPEDSAISVSISSQHLKQTNPGLAAIISIVLCN